MTAVPPDWKSQDVSDDKGERVLLCAPHGYITVDYGRRGFSLGVTQFHRTLESPTYSGRGWRAQLLSDAVDELLKFI